MRYILSPTWIVCDISIARDIFEVNLLRCHFQEIFAYHKSACIWKISNSGRKRWKTDLNWLCIRFTKLVFSTSLSFIVESCIYLLSARFRARNLNTLRILLKMIKCKKLLGNHLSHINIFLNHHFESLNDLNLFLFTCWDILPLVLSSAFCFIACCLAFVIANLSKLKKTWARKTTCSLQWN